MRPSRRAEHVARYSIVGQAVTACGVNGSQHSMLVELHCEHFGFSACIGVILRRRQV